MTTSITELSRSESEGGEENEVLFDIGRGVRYIARQAKPALPDKLDKSINLIKLCVSEKDSSLT